MSTLPQDDKPTKPKPETWQDWGGPNAPEPNELLTRDELIERLNRLGVAARGRTISHWQEAGALPYPVRRWHNGATRAVWPDWIVALAAEIPRLRREGVPLREIGNRLRPWRSIHAHDEGRIAGEDAASAAIIDVPTAQAKGEGLAPTVVARVPVGGRARVTEPTDEDLAGMIAALARRYQQLSGIPVGRVEVRFTDPEGTTRTHQYPPRDG